MKIQLNVIDYPNGLRPLADKLSGIEFELPYTPQVDWWLSLESFEPTKHIKSIDYYGYQVNSILAHPDFLELAIIIHK